MTERNEGTKASGNLPPDSLSVSASFLAYEIISAAAFALLFAPYALFKMIGTPSFRAGIGQRLSLPSAMNSIEIGTAPVWIQAVSLGEVKSVAPLVRKIADNADLPVFLTSTTATGYEAASRLLAPKRANALFPLDFRPVVNRSLASVRPRVIVLFETEIWPNFIRAAASRGIPVCIVNGRISEKSYRCYRAVPKIFKHVLSQISYAGMQSQQDARRALELGVPPDAVEVCGNVKFDSASTLPPYEAIEKLRNELDIAIDAKVIVAGSTHEGEEASLIEAYRKILDRCDRVRLVIAPRHPERFDGVETAIRTAGFSVQRRTTGKSKHDSDGKSVILLDTIGELASVYALASVAFVGGSLAKVGGHNIIEPASMGKPVLFGPFMHHFEDVKEAFQSEKAAICVADEEQLCETILSLLDDPEKATAVGNAAKRVVEANRGATDRYYQALCRYF